MVTPRLWLEQIDPPRSPRETLPTMYDLPSEDPEEPGLPDEFHDLQPQLLSATLRLSGYPRDQVFTGTDLNLYYDVHHPLWHKRPDWFLVVGVPRLYDGVDLRSSYVIWQEGVHPFVVVELLSPGTQTEDLGPYADSSVELSQGEGAIARTDASANGQPPATVPPRKWEVYEKILRVPYYIVFSRYTNQLRCFQQVGGHYQEQPLRDHPPRLWIPELDLGLGVWQGRYDNVQRSWLRWCDADGNWIPTPQEQVVQEQQLVQQEQQRVQQEQQRTQQEQQRADRLAERLRQLGIDPEQV
jgi:Uma2 family endonuclease